MKKIITLIVVSIFISSFYMVYEDFIQDKSYSLKNSEYELEDVKNVIVPSKLTSLPRGVQYKTLFESTKGGISLYFTRIEEVGEKEKIIKYIHINNDDYMKKFKLLEGRYLNAEDMDSYKYVSTEKSDDPNQVGVIASVDNLEMEIKTLRAMLEDDYILNGECVVQLEGEESLEYFAALFIDSVDAEIIVSDAETERKIIKKSDFQIIPLIIILFIVILYYLICEYKKIAIEKMLGYSEVEICRNRIVKLFILCVIAIILTSVFMSMIMFKRVNILYLEFFKTLGVKYLMIIGIILVGLMLPFIYIKSIKIISLIKNQKNIKEVILLNNVVKVCLSVGIITLIIFQFKEYKTVEDVFNNNYKKWEKVGEYKVLSLNNLHDGIVENREFVKSEIEAYEDFNEKGAILAAFDGYSESNIKMNEYMKAYTRYAEINPNYLKENIAYDIQGNQIVVEDENKNLVLLVPDKYKNDEKEIREIYEEHARNGKTKLELIWMKSGQEFFSYDFTVGTKNGNMVKDPVLWVATQEGPFKMFFTYLFNTVGNPIKIKSNDDKEIEDIIKKYKLDIHGLKINKADDQVVSKVEGYKEALKWATFGIVSSILIVLFIIIQNTLNYIEQSKREIAIKKMNGYTCMQRYKEYGIQILGTWLIVMLIASIINKGYINLVVGIGVIGLILDIIINLVVIKLREKDKILKFIKGGF
ncbi:MAG: DUF1430 domain-containing protein [Clostridium sp.]|uniref:DUF1430 domain-containing protein n=1 Tax=Clostridium sp. TaxID=1506 RepID=UPI003F394215